jgi:hypothetical protein
MGLETLPNELKKEIFSLVNETDSLNQLAKVSKDFRKISKETVSESLSKSLRYYKKHGQHYDKAMVAATLLSTSKHSKMLQMLRVALKAFHEHRLIETFLRWRTDTEAVSFYSELMKMSKARVGFVTNTDKEFIRIIFLCNQDYIDTLKKRNLYRPTWLMDFIVRYVYHQSIERSFEQLTM